MDLMFRPPIVTILGHVDHGKTSLLDFIRKSRLVAKEHGGITQRIGAYEVETGLTGYATSRITFIDTPGHEAFTQLRSRGAKSADIAVLVIDAKDSLMPQTIESIAHIQAAKIPFIVALNKIDLPEANPTKVERDLLKYNVQTEKQGGRVPAVPISAKTGKGIPELLETILYLANDLKLACDPHAPAQAIVVETSKDKRGLVVSIILQNGTLAVGDTLFATDGETAKVRALVNDLGKHVRSIQPSTPVQVLGFDAMPAVGSYVLANPQLKHSSPPSFSSVKTTKPQAFNLQSVLAAQAPAEKKLSIILKADSQGSLEALERALSQNDKIDIVLSGVGEVHRSDVFLAKATGAVIIGFAVSADAETEVLSRQEKVIIKSYTVIYEILDELEEVANLIAEKEAAAKNLKGEAKVLATFDIEGEKVFGMTVVKGKFSPGDEVQVLRSGQVFGKTKLVSLQIRAKKVQEVKKGEECGMLFSPTLDIRVGDVVQCVL
jgi:translation initiation factor IF-2